MDSQIVKRIRTITFFVVLPCLIFAQGTLLEKRLTELKTQLSESAPDTNRVRILYNIGRTFTFIGGRYDSAVHYSMDALKLAQQLENELFVARALYHVGEQHVDINDEKALDYFHQADQIGRKYNNKPLNAAIASARAGCLLNLGDYTNARNNFLTALSLLEQGSGEYALQGAAMFNNNIGRTYDLQGKFDDAVKYFIEAKIIYEKLDDQFGLADVSYNISGSYFESGNYGSGFEWLKDATNLYKTVGDKSNVFYCYRTYAEKYLEQEENDVAAKYVDSCFQLVPELDTDGYDWYKGESQYIRAILLTKTGDYELAINEFQNAWDIYVLNEAVQEQRELVGKLADTYLSSARNNSNVSIPSNMELTLIETLQESESAHDFQGVVNSAESLVGIYEIRGEFKNAYEFLRKLVNFKDSLQTREQISAIAEFETQLRTEQKEKENLKLANDLQIQKLELDRQQTIQYFLGGGALLLFLLAAVLYNRYQIKERSNKLISAEKSDRTNYY